MAKAKKASKKRAKRPGNLANLKKGQQRGQNLMKAGWSMVRSGEARDIKQALKFLSSEIKYAGNPKNKKGKKKAASGKKRAAPKGAKARMQKALALYRSGQAHSMPEALQMLAGSRSLLY